MEKTKNTSNSFYPCHYNKSRSNLQEQKKTLHSVFLSLVPNKKILKNNLKEIASKLDSLDVFALQSILDELELPINNTKRLLKNVKVKP